MNLREKENEMTKIHDELPGVLTCPEGHFHGYVIVHLTWESTEPFALVVEVTPQDRWMLGSTVHGVAERETFAQCAAHGDVSCEVYGTPGAVTFKIRATEHEVMTIAVPHELPDGRKRVVLTAFERASAIGFITRTYDEVPAGREDCDIDHLAARLLYS